MPWRKEPALPCHFDFFYFFLDGQLFPLFFSFGFKQFAERIYKKKVKKMERFKMFAFWFRGPAPLLSQMFADDSSEDDEEVDRFLEVNVADHWIDPLDFKLLVLPWWTGTEFFVDFFSWQAFCGQLGEPSLGYYGANHQWCSLECECPFGGIRSLSSHHHTWLANAQ